MGIISIVSIWRDDREVNHINSQKQNLNKK